MRNEQLVAIGTLAAVATHALGTLLSIMSILLTELDNLSAETLAAAIGFIAQHQDDFGRIYRRTNGI